ncbi:hypothetical protein BEL04_16105 [Mucilaginibacter sp. PPCGB 2223]|nr:hypothetical protein BEL04_16105 [Mucilaginibacter sp. PPCGB 2223]
MKPTKTSLYLGFLTVLIAFTSATYFFIWKPDTGYGFPMLITAVILTFRVIYILIVRRKKQQAKTQTALY